MPRSLPATRRHLPTVVAVALVVAASGAGVARAQGPGVAFEDERPLALKADSPADLRTVSVCNVSGADARPPVPSVSRFEKGSDAPVALMRAEITGGNAAPWPAGDCRDVVLTLDEGATLAAGSYAGVLTVTSSEGIARRNVTLTGPDAVPKPATGKAATEAVTLRARRDHPWAAAELEDGGTLLLKPAAEGEQLSVPRDCKAKPSAGAKGSAPAASPQPEACPFVGNVIKGEDVADISVAGPLKEDGEQPAELPLKISGADGAGTYAGTLDLAGTPDPADDVKLSVAVKDAWWSALVALLLGAALAFGAQYGLRASWPKGRLRRRYRKFDTDYGTAVSEFNQRRKKAGDWVPPDTKAVRDEIGKGVGRYRRSTVYWDTSSDAYKELDKSVALVEDDIECLKAPERLTAALASLAEALEELKGKYPTLRDPKFVTEAAALLEGPPQTDDGKRPLVVGQALTIAATAKETEDLVAAWRKLAERLLKYERWWMRLAEKALEDQPTAPWPATDLTKLKDAASTLGEVKEELLTAADPAELSKLGTAADVDRIYTNLAYLSGLHGGWPQADEEPLAAVSLDLLAQFDLMGTRFAVQSEQGRDGSRTEATPPEASEAIAAELRDVGGVLVAALAIAFTIAVAVVTGLAAFYFGKDTWGTTEDYITVIVVGAAATALVQTIVDAVSRLLPSAPEQLITGPVAAILKPATTKAAPEATGEAPDPDPAGA